MVLMFSEPDKKFRYNVATKKIEELISFEIITGENRK